MRTQYANKKFNKDKKQLDFYLLIRRWYDSPRQVKYTDPCSLISEP